jgi:hypothetical protein
VTCIRLPNGGIACTRGHKPISKEALQRDLELIEQFERDLEAGKYEGDTPQIPDEPSSMEQTPYPGTQS